MQMTAPLLGEPDDEATDAVAKEACGEATRFAHIIVDRGTSEMCEGCSF